MMIVWGVFTFDPVFSFLFGFCRKKGLGGGVEAPPKR